MIESAGSEVIDLGIDVPDEKFVEAIKQNPECKVVGADAYTPDAGAAAVKAVELVSK